MMAAPAGCGEEGLSGGSSAPASQDAVLFNDDAFYLCMMQATLDELLQWLEDVFVPQPDN